mgnify:CR=1 FL=1
MKHSLSKSEQQALIANVHFNATTDRNLSGDEKLTELAEQGVNEEADQEDEERGVDLSEHAELIAGSVTRGVLLDEPAGKAS